MAQITTTNQMVREFARVLDRPVSIIPMDLGCLRYLAESGGSAPTIAIPLKLFAGEIPEGHPNLVDLGLIEHRGDITLITPAGLKALAA